MSGYADSEKIQYALKTALYRTMQTSMSDSASVERSAPLRVFPTNIMKVNIIEAGKGDIGEDGTYVTGHATAGQTADLSDPESTVKNYKIICPVNNVITDKTISWLVGYGSSTKSYVDGRGTSGTSYPLKQWFFRGHYSGSGEAAFNAANVTYDGLQLAWNSATNGATPSEADIVPHLKYYLQVQTNYTGVSHSSSADNITYEHGLLKGLIGLDSNFISTIMVTQGEGGPSSSASLGTSGSQAGDFWFTQPTAGVLSFYGVTNKVDASTDLATANFATKYPMVSYVRYTGETGFGAGTGGGGGSVSLVSADTNVSNMIGGTAQTMTTTSFNFDGNVGIGTIGSNTSAGMADPRNAGGLYIKPLCGIEFLSCNGDAAAIVSSRTWRVRPDDGAWGSLFFSVSSGNSNYPAMTDDVLTLASNGNVGIGTASPGAKLDITKNGPTSTTDPNATEMLRFKSPFTSGKKEEGGFKFITDDTNAGTAIYPRLTLYAYQGTGSVWEPQAITFKTTSSTNVNVGIGTTSPSNKLHLKDDWPLKIEHKTHTSYHMIFNYNQIYTTGQKLYLNWNDQNDVIICGQGGNVGIGTSSPKAKLQVTGTSTNPSTSTQSSTSSQGILRLNGSGGLFMDFGFMLSSPYTGWIQTHNGTTDGTGDDLALQPVSGNVGIGTTSPNAKLDVNGNIYANGLIYLSDYIQHIGDSNTKIGFPSNDNIYFYCAGTVQMRINNNGVGIHTDAPANSSTRFQVGGNVYVSGNVGIGLTDPASPLEIQCTAGGNSHNTQWTGAKGLRLKRSVDGHAWEIVNGYHNDLLFRNMKADGTIYRDNVLMLDDNANVGIGTNSPSSNLHVASHQTNTGSAHAMQPSAIFSNENSSNSSHSEYHTLCGYGLHHIDNYKSSTLQSYASTSSGTNIYLNYYSQGNVDLVRGTLHVESDKVGIGTTSPEYHLDIRGSGNQVINVYSNGTGEAYARFSYNNNTTSGGLLYTGAMQNQVFLNSRYNYPMVFYTNNTERMRILAGGKVGIGTDNPSSIFHIKDTSPILRIESTSGDVDGRYAYIEFLDSGGAFAWMGDGGGANKTFYIYASDSQPIALMKGNVGIRTDSPSYNLDLAYNGSNNNGFRVTGSSRSITIRNDELNSSGGLFLNYNGNAVYYSGSNQISDNRIKHNEKPLSNTLQIINKLKPQKYFKSFKMYDKNHHYELDSSGNPITNDKFSIETGFIAQDIQEIPELAYLVEEIPDKSNTDENGEKVNVPSRLALSYTDIFVMNVAATQELYKENQELKTEVATLKTELAAIKQHLGI